MIEALTQMFWPLMACLVLVGIHAYLGIHVIERKVIFVDLALAQIAGLGAVYGVFIGLSFDSDAWAIKGISVAFTFVGALLFAFTRTRDERIPHEAIIGIIYAAT
jgi:zinc/manganese transport system permease protein